MEKRIVREYGERELPPMQRLKDKHEMGTGTEWRCFRIKNPNLLPYETIVRATSGEPEAVGITARESGLPPLKTGISTGIPRTA